MLNIFGLNPIYESSQLILIPVPWEVTTSYGRGTSRGPESILKASSQIDLYDSSFSTIYKKGFYLLAPEKKLQGGNEKLNLLAQKSIDHWNETGEPLKGFESDLDHINHGCEQMVQQVYAQSMKELKRGKLVGVIGGDHSTPLGLIQALSEEHSGNFGVLHIDAHADLRKAYQGFKYSHASIMYNVLNLPQPPQKIVQVGIRDFCEEEWERMNLNPQQIQFFLDEHLKSNAYNGMTWKNQVYEIIKSLPKKVYVSFDIDGLSPELCPHTGTPVPGGLDFSQASFLLEELVRSKRQIIGFDLCEVAPSPKTQDEWDANVGARILYKLCGWAMMSSDAT